MLRSVLRGVRHLQCGIQNAATIQVAVPITGYYQRRLRHDTEFIRYSPHRQPINRPRFNNFNNNTNSRQQQDIIELEPVDWENETLSPCKREDYVPHPNGTDCSNTAIEAYREENQIKIEGTDVNPILSFDETTFNSDTVERLKSTGWEKPTPIQAQTWPIVLSNQNVIGICHTGSGKTLCYVLPALEHIRRQKENHIPTFDEMNFTYSPFVLVLVPTRELATQVLDVVRSYSPRSVSTVAVYGGVKDEWYYRQGKRGVDMCIATPGRLLALLRDNKINLKNCTYLVVDEADNMLDMGFQKSIHTIMSQCRPDRQLLMWTATWSSDIQDLAHSYLKKHAVVRVGASDQTPNKNITQHLEVCSERQKLEKLLNLLASIRQNDREGKIIVFANTIRTVKYLQEQVYGEGLHPLMLSGPMQQQKRSATIRGFATRPGAVLIATDVASRGLDLEGVDYIINYDFPPVVKTYVHRIGRCGRKAIRGTSYTFLTEEDKRHVEELVPLLQESKQEVPQELLMMKAEIERARMPRRRGFRY